MDYSDHNFLFDQLRISQRQEYDIVEFGTYSGSSIIEIAKQAWKNNVPIRKIFTIDSFCGLPKELDGIPKHKDWVENAYDARQYFGVKEKEDCIEAIKNKIEQADLKFPIQIIPKYFSTLNDWHIRKWDIKKVCYVNIDCDLYISAMDALHFIFQNDLLVPNGFIRYDDYHAINNGGECLAHKHICTLYGLEFMYIDRSVFQYLGKDKQW